MQRHSFWLRVTAILALGIAAADAEGNVLTENFDDGSLDPRLEIVTYPGFHVALANGRAEFSKDAGVPAFGTARINTQFRLTGDFDLEGASPPQYPNYLWLV